MKRRLLIISPYFPPSNAADMQRVRMSLPYFKQFGWDAEVVAVDPHYTEITKDGLLLQSVPAGIKIHLVKALKKSWTSKFGLGSIALRSFFYYRKTVNSLLKTGRFDLVYFSTTQFPVCILGAYWKKRYGVPYVIDMQDPWHSEYYQDKPRDQRPKKYWFSYRLNKFLEPKAMNHVDGLISVSDKYISDLKERYTHIKNIPVETITFGAFEPDFEIARENSFRYDSILNPATINLVYIGRGGHDMHKATELLFNVFSQLLKTDASFSKIKIWFIGTSYAPPGEGVPTLLPLAEKFGIADHVIEITDRISYYHTLNTLQQADALFVPGSDDPKYTASKIFPYLLAKKPLLAIFNKESSAISILHEYKAKDVYHFDDPKIQTFIESFLNNLLNKKLPTPEYDPAALEKYDAQNMTRSQCHVFENVIELKK